MCWSSGSRKVGKIVSFIWASAVPDTQLVPTHSRVCVCMCQCPPSWEALTSTESVLISGLGSTDTGGNPKAEYHVGV